RLDAAWHRLPLRILRRIHAVDHPILAVRPKQDVAALHALSVENDHHLAFGPFFGVVGPAVPDRDVAGAVVAGRNVARVVDVSEGMVLDVHGQVVLLRVGWHAFRNRPGDKHSITLQPEVPVEPARVVLLDTEPRRLGSLSGHLGAGFARLLEVAFGLILGELPGHDSRLGYAAAASATSVDAGLSARTKKVARAATIRSEIGRIRVGRIASTNA